MLYELIISYPHSQTITAAVRHTLHASGIKTNDIVESRTGETVSLTYYCDNPHRARALQTSLRGNLPRGAKTAVRRLPDGWQTKWQRDFKPFNLTSKLRVVPAWLKAKDRDLSGKHIYIDTSMAFGTGMHPTTKAVAAFIEETATGCRDLLDLGAGTGILTIVARRCGIRKLAAMDISPDAVATARRNFRLNRCAGVTLRCSDIGSLPGRKTFDFVAANILVPVLLANRETIVGRVREGGLLALSGIWHRDAPRLMRRFEAAGLARLKVRRSSGWVSILYRRDIEKSRTK